MTDGTDENIELELLPDDTKPEDDLVVEKTTEEPVQKAEKPAEPTPEAPLSADDGILKLKEQLENERNARAESDRRANEAAQRAHQAQTEAQDSNLHLVINAISTVQQSNEILKANLSAAYAAQDFDTVASIQMELSTNAAKLMQLEQGKQALESAPKQQQAPQPYVNDPVEALASQLSPRSADWVRRHPEYARDPRMTQKMLAAHNLVTADGVQPDTDDYFSAIETTLRIKPAEEAPAPVSAASEAVSRRSAPPAAPVSRSTSGTGTSTNTNRVTLTAAEREMAEMMGQTYEEYGRNKLALQREGKLH